MSRERLFTAFRTALIVLGAVGAAAFTMSFPAVEGLGSKVRLPVFHGGLTWVNLTLFVMLAAVGVVYLVRRSAVLYAWVEALRWVSIGLWFVGSSLGLIAALRVWDFTASNSSPLSVVMEDPRLMAQFWTLLLALGVLALGLLIDERRMLAGVDVAFVVAALAIIASAVLGPGRALHPDSPVLNSDEIAIKLIFFGIVGSQAAAMTGAVWFVAASRVRAALRTVEPEPQPTVNVED